MKATYDQNGVFMFICSDKSLDRISELWFQISGQVVYSVDDDFFRNTETGPCWRIFDKDGTTRFFARGEPEIIRQEMNRYISRYAEPKGSLTTGGLIHHYLTYKQGCKNSVLIAQKIPFFDLKEEVEDEEG